MSTFRIHKDKTRPFVIVDKGFIQDPKISAKATGILLYLLSRPDNWQIYESEITKHFKDGIRAIRTGIQELILCGYIHRQQLRNKGQFSHYEYHVYETPTKSIPDTEMLKRDIGKQHTTNKDITKHRKKGGNGDDYDNTFDPRYYHDRPYRELFDQA